ncbi:MAG: cupin domain-containing protein [Verrucomicrobiae bacterium]|nr:cupin domain-containing protein [Verrucomicrobiae bacterium]
MTTRQFLSGRLTVESLPVLPIPLPADAPVRKRLRLPQGELAQLRDGDEAVHYLAVLELQAGGVRGHHVHQRKRESLYLISGAVTLLAEDPADRQRIALDLHPGDLARIEPGVAHALQTVTPGWAIEFAPHPLDPSDSHPYRLD